MKRCLALVFALLLALGAAACADGAVSAPPAAPEPSETPGGKAAVTFDGKVVGALDGALLVTGTGLSAGLVTASLSGAALEDALGGEISPDEIVPGMTVRITYGGLVLEKYPMQLGAPAKIAVTGQGDDMVGFWLTVIEDLREVDPGLNSDISVIALDLTEAENLTEGEKEALTYLAGSALGIEGISGTFDELCDMGYIDKDKVYFEDGILVTLEVTGTGDDTFTFNANKWRSGLGAYFYFDCTATKDSSGWSYTIGGEAIS